MIHNTPNYAHILSGIHMKWLLYCIQRIAYSVALELCWMPLRWHSIRFVFQVALENWSQEEIFSRHRDCSAIPHAGFILFFFLKQPKINTHLINISEQMRIIRIFGCEIDSFRYLLKMVCSKIRLLQIVVENDFGGKVAVPLAEQLGYMACYANNNNGPRFV